MKSLVIKLLLLICSALAMKIVALLLLIGFGGSENACTEGTCTKQGPSPTKDQLEHPPPTWHMDDPHPCNIDILSREDFEQQFPRGFPSLYHKPVILRLSENNQRYRDESRKESIKSLFPSDVVHLPAANLYSFATNNVTVEEYINLPETTSWEIAGEKLYMLTDQVKDFDNYNMPRVDALTKAGQYRLGMGSLGSGAQWHNHGPGFCESMHGRKHWLLVEKNRPAYDRDRPSRHWFEYMYTDYTDEYLWECTLHPGDAIYFPHKFWHTTLNLDPYIVFVTTFFDTTTEAFEALKNAKSSKL